MENQRPVRCSENEELASYLWRKREEMAEPNGISENLDLTLSNAYRNICNSKTPIKTLKDLSQIKGVGKWILRLMQGFFPKAASDTSQTENMDEKGKKAKGPRRYVPQKNSVAYALLITLYREIVNGNSFMKKQELIDAAEASGLSRTSIGPDKGKGKPGQFGSSGRDWYTGWSCMKTLITKGLVVKSSSPAKYMLTPEGQEAARECLSRSGLVDSAEPLITTGGSQSHLDGTSEVDFVRATYADNGSKFPSATLICQMDSTSINFLDRNIGSGQVDSSDADLAELFEKDCPGTLTACTSIDMDRSNRANFTSGSELLGPESSFSTDSSLRSFSLRACTSFEPPMDSSSDVDALDGNINGLAMPPRRTGEKFEDVYDLILLLDDRENFGSRARKVVDNFRSQFKIQVEVVTDNASSNVAAGRMLMEKRRHIFWTPCAAHCLDLMLEYIGKLRGISSVIIKARAVTRFMYKHTLLLNLMRKHTKGRDLVRAGVTRFATSFLTLQSLHIHKVELRKLFVSAEWIQSSWVKKPEGQHVANTILSQTFWNGVTRALLASQPIVSVLRLVERVDKPPMGYVYQAMLNAIEKIKKSFNNNERDYLPIVKVVEDRWTDHMSHPIHQAACFLKPSIYYEERAKGEEGECRVGQYKLAFLDCVEKMVQDFHIEDKISTDLKAYTDASGTFGKDMAIRQRLTTSALDWWDSYGVATPELRRVALRILGLTCSASDCERNWSTFEHVRHLPVGDGMWIVRHKHFNNEYVLDFIVERKRVDDLCSSIRDNRYKDQKMRLLRCGLRKLIYLVEGDPNTLEAAESIKSACFTTEILEGFDVQRTSGLTDTVKRYGYLTQAIKQYYSTQFSSGKSKSCAVCLSYDEFIKKCHDLEKMTVSDVFALQLMQVPQVTEEIALAVIELYPTLFLLARAYSLLEGDIHAQEEMLKNRSKVISGPASRNIFKLVWGC